MHGIVELLKHKLENQSVVILGFGREGQSSYSLFRRIFPEKKLAVADLNPGIREHSLLLNDPDLMTITGADYLDRIGSFDLIVRSPGIPIWKLVSIDADAVHGCESGGGKIPIHKITSQTDLFLQAYGDQVIGVTGTKGKSTTSSLIHHLLKTAGKDSILAGNIGNPPFHFIDQITPKTRIVLELSSHQLEYIRKGPHIAIILNLFQEHLDAYADFASYQNAKINITRFQAPDDILIYNTDDRLVEEWIRPLISGRTVYPFSLTHSCHPGGYKRGDDLFFDDGVKEHGLWKIHQERFLRGEHNLKNILAAALATRLCGISREELEDGLDTFKGLEHRLEYVGEYRGIHFYNDSIATIPEACMEAIRAVPMVDTLVAGGFDRGIDYAELATFLCHSSIRNFIFTGQAGKRVGTMMEQEKRKNKKIFYIHRFDDFKEIAFRVTRPGYGCLLSPAAASYDEFNNFEERGKRFRELVKQNG